MISSSVQQTHKLAQEISKNLKSNLLCLYGNLGSGKTTFVQGLARALGIKKRILSPTFVLAREYPVSSIQYQVSSVREIRKRKSGYSDTGHVDTLYHIDCYRVESEKDLKSINLPEIWSDKKNLVVIEWAERLANILPKTRIDIKFEYIDKKKRKIEIANC